MPPKGWRKGDGLARDNPPMPAKPPETANSATQTPPPATSAQPEPSATPCPVSGDVAMRSVKFGQAVWLAGKVVQSVLAEEGTTLEPGPWGVVLRRGGDTVLVPWANVVSAVLPS
jgi:hypothetical protein